jgi:RNA polymerase sigma-70 factor (ECF subfamily)
LIVEPADTELFERARRGDESAFGALYDRRQGGIYRFAVQMTGSSDMAQEIVQETFVALARDLSRYDPAQGTVSAYLYGIAGKLALKHLGRRQRETALDNEEHDLAASAAGPLDGMLQDESAERVRRAVLSLPAAYRQAVVLCDLQELSYGEAAAAMGCPVGTVRSKLNRGRALLAERMRAARGCAV